MTICNAQAGRQAGRQADISVIRLIAFLFVLFCHVLQYYDVELAFWLNVGVQMFLCVSGYLYGQKEIELISFYKKTFVKILIPYFTCLILFSCIQALAVPNEINLSKFASALIGYGRLNGGEHLWFVPTILMCYMLTPLFSAVMQGAKRNYLATVVVIIGINIAFYIFIPYYEASWITCYFIGYLLGFYAYSINKQSVRKYKMILLLLCFMNIIQIYIDYVINPSFSSRIFEKAYAIWKNYNHVWLGVTLFLLLQKLFIRLKIKTTKMLDYSDKCLYEAYLVHQFFILGPLSLMKITYSAPINVILILILVFSCSMLLNKLNQLIIRIIYERIDGL